jgi:hypothetical protein
MMEKMNRGESNSGRDSFIMDSFEKINVDFDSCDLSLDNNIALLQDDNDDFATKLLGIKELPSVDDMPDFHDEDNADDDDDDDDDINFIDRLNLDLQRNQNINIDGVGDNVSLAGSESSIDKLLSMNIIEMDDAGGGEGGGGTVDINVSDSDVMKTFAEGFFKNEQGNIQQDYQDNQHYYQQNINNNNNSNNYDPLLGKLSNHSSQEHQPYYNNDNTEQQEQMMMMMMMMNQQSNNHNNNNMQYQQQQLLMQMQMQQMEYHDNNNNSNDAGGGMDSAKLSQLQQMGSADLEREKMKLLSRLQEINSRQQAPAMMMMQQQQQQQQQQQNQRPAGLVASNSGVASIIGTGGGAAVGGGTTGETPLQSFLRSKNKGGVASVATAMPSKASMLSQNIPGAPAAASIFTAAPMDFRGSPSSNPFLRPAAAGTGNPLLASMSKSSSSQNMIRQTLSGRNLRASGVSLSGRSDPKLMDMLRSDVGGGAGGGGGGGQNATWGSSGMSSGAGRSAYTSSGILPKHASDGHLLGAGNVSASLAKQKNRIGSISRENSLYNLMKNKQGSHKNLNSLVRQGSNQRLGSLTKSGSRGGLHGSSGSLLPARRGGGRVNTKHKLGASVSVPYMRMNTSPAPGHQGNALW